MQHSGYHIARNIVVVVTGEAAVIHLLFSNPDNNRNSFLRH